MGRLEALVLLCGLLPWPCAARGGPGELYCGQEDCYFVLGLSRDAPPSDVKKAFRKLALQWHPDKNRSPSATAKFRSIGRANEVLSDERLRRAYDHYLDNPEDSYRNYYNYYHASYTPKTPLWMVVLGVLLFLSGLQYINQQWRYSSMMRAIRYQPAFKRRVDERLKEEVAGVKGSVKRVDQRGLRGSIEQQVLESEVQVHGSGSRPASLQSLVLIRAACLPCSFSVGLYRFLLWHWRFSCRGEAYGQDERTYLTRRALGHSDAQWGSLVDQQRQELIDRELWLPGNLRAFNKEREEEMQERLVQSGAYRRYRRFMRKSG